jgi:hypothetical protein
VAATVGGRGCRSYATRTVTTYAVKWREPDGQTFIGRLALGQGTLRLVGRRPGVEGPGVDRQIGYAELQGLRIGSTGADRLDGRPALVVERADGPYVVADAGTGAPVVQELVERLAGLRLAAPRTATVILPLEEGALDRVRELVRHGPPFDPEETPLTRHELLLTPREAIFVFETQTEDGLLKLLSQLDILAAAAAWRELVAGPPRLAEVAYSWERPEQDGAPSGRFDF